MQVIRYLNGKRLRGAMPPLLLNHERVGDALRTASRWQELPLPTCAPSAILKTEERGLGREL